MKTFSITDYTNQTSSTHFTEKMSKFKTPIKENENNEMYTK